MLPRFLPAIYNLTPAQKAALRDAFADWLHQNAEQIRAEALTRSEQWALAHASDEILEKVAYEAIWWAVIKGIWPTTIHMYRNIHTGDETLGAIWEYASGALECVIDEPGMGEHNGVAAFRSNFPDEPVVGTQWRRAHEFMVAQGYVATGQSRPFER